MLSGRKLDILSPSPFDIEIEDIALGLSRVTRWNGQTTGKHPYSVAQHSMLVEEIFNLEYPNSNKRPDAMLKLGTLLKEQGLTDESLKILNELVTQYPSTTAAKLATDRLSN